MFAWFYSFFIVFSCFFKYSFGFLIRGLRSQINISAHYFLFISFVCVCFGSLCTIFIVRYWRLPLLYVTFWLTIAVVAEKVRRIGTDYDRYRFLLLLCGWHSYTKRIFNCFKRLNFRTRTTGIKPKKDRMRFKTKSTKTV